MNRKEIEIFTPTPTLHTRSEGSAMEALAIASSGYSSLHTQVVVLPLPPAREACCRRNNGKKEGKFLWLPPRHIIDI